MIRVVDIDLPKMCMLFLLLDTHLVFHTRSNVILQLSIGIYPCVVRYEKTPFGFHMEHPPSPDIYPTLRHTTRAHI